MNKKTLELERLTNHRKGYGLLCDKTWNENDVLNKIVEWSQGKNITIYKHLLRIEGGGRGGRYYWKIWPHRWSI